MSVCLILSVEVPTLLKKKKSGQYSGLSRLYMWCFYNNDENKTRIENSDNAHLSLDRFRKGNPQLSQLCAREDINCFFNLIQVDNTRTDDISTKIKELLQTDGATVSKDLVEFHTEIQKRNSLKSNNSRHVCFGFKIVFECMNRIVLSAFRV